MRALLRLGWREAWRHQLRSALVVALVAVPVGLSGYALMMVSELGGSGSSWDLDGLGDADVRITSSDPVTAWSAAATLDEAGTSLRGQAATFVEAATFTGWVARRGDLVEQLSIEQVDSSSLLAGRDVMDRGRRPSTPGEAALDATTMRRLGVGVGDRLDLAVPDVELTVVGRLAPDEVVGVDAVLAPGTVGRPAAPTEADPFPAGWVEMNWKDVVYAAGLSESAFDSLSVLGAQTWPEQPTGLSVVFGPELIGVPLGPDGTTDAVQTRTWIVAGGAFALLWTGLVAASGLAVSARRRKRDLGLLAANGADPGQLRVAVVAEGLVLGTLGASIGSALAAVAAYAVVPSIAARLTGELPGWDVEYSVPWQLVVWLVGVGAATCAAWSASIGVVSMTPAQLLRGQRRTPRSAPSWFGAGAALFVVGCVALRWSRGMDGSTPWGEGLRQLVIAMGVLTVTLGVVAVVVGATRLGGRLTARAPASIRLAGRDLSRHGVRIAAATAAISLTLTGSMAVATFHDQRSGDQRVANERLAEFEGRAPAALVDGAALVGWASPNLSRLVDGRVRPLSADDATVGVFADEGIDVGILSRVPDPDGTGHGLEVCQDAWVVDESGRQRTTEVSCSPADVIVADPTVIDLLPSDVGTALQDGEVVSVHGSGRVMDRGGSPLEVRQVDLRFTNDDGAQMGTSLMQDVWVSERTATRLGVDPATSTQRSVYFDAGAVDPAQMETARSLARDLGFDLQLGSWNEPSSGSWDDRAWVTLAFGVVTAVTLLIVLITLALVRVESRREDDVLLVAGASPGLARRVGAARAGLIVVAAALPAAVGGWFVARALMRGQVGVPWWAIGLGVVVLPAVAALLAGTFHRPPRRLRLG